jgi:pyridinium-3,5-biscarboxylic acid mononucleotide sulfurtransferase
VIITLDPSCRDEDRAAADAVGSLLAGRTPLGVALSGGVDSSVLLALASRALGSEQVVARLGVSASLATVERAAAHDVAGLAAVASGENADDVRRPDRPGARAATEHAILRRLKHVGRTAGFRRVVLDAEGIRSGAFTLPLVGVADA